MEEDEEEAGAGPERRGGGRGTGEGDFTLASRFTAARALSSFPRAASDVLWAISRITTDCSSTAALMVTEASFTDTIVWRISAIACAADVVEVWTCWICAAIWSVALAVWPASSRHACVC